MLSPGEVTKEYLLENCTLDADYITSVYFTVITLLTVGYGDVNPQSDYGRMFGCLILMITIIVIPAQSSQILNLMSKKSPY
jgi:hypothetical protein